MGQSIQSVVAFLAGVGFTVLVSCGVGIAVERFTNVLVVLGHSRLLDTRGSFVLVSARLLVSVLAGALVAPWLSSRRKIGHAIACGLFTLLLALFDGAPPVTVQPVWFTVIQPVMLVPAAICGGLGALWVGRIRAA